MSVDSNRRARRMGLGAAAALVVALAGGASLLATSPGDTMHVQDVTFVSDRECKAWARVLVVDQNGVGVEGATVSGEWRETYHCRGGRRTAVTDGNGVATMRGTSCKRGCWWSPEPAFVVTGVEHAVATYDPSANVESSATGSVMGCQRSNNCGWDF